MINLIYIPKVFVTGSKNKLILGGFVVNIIKQIKIRIKIKIEIRLLHLILDFNFL